MVYDLVYWCTGVKTGAQSLFCDTKLHFYEIKGKTDIKYQGHFSLLLYKTLFDESQPGIEGVL